MNNFLDILAKAQDLSRFQEKVDWLKKQAPKGIAWGRLCELVIEFEKSKEHYKARWNSILFEVNPVCEIYSDETFAKLSREFCLDKIG